MRVFLVILLCLATHVSGQISTRTLQESLKNMKLGDLFSEKTLQAAVGVIRDALERAEERDADADIDLFGLDADETNQLIAEEASARLEGIIIPDALISMASKIQQLGSQMKLLTSAADIERTNKLFYHMSRAIQYGSDPARVLNYLNNTIKAPLALDDARNNNIAVQNLQGKMSDLVSLAGSVKTLLGGADRRQLFDVMAQGVRGVLEGQAGLDFDSDGDQTSPRFGRPVQPPNAGSAAVSATQKPDFFAFLRGAFSTLSDVLQRSSANATDGALPRFF